MRVRPYVSYMRDLGGAIIYPYALRILEADEVGHEVWRSAYIHSKAGREGGAHGLGNSIHYQTGLRLTHAVPRRTTTSLISQAGPVLKAG